MKAKNEDFFSSEESKLPKMNMKFLNNFVFSKSKGLQGNIKTNCK